VVGSGLMGGDITCPAAISQFLSKIYLPSAPIAAARVSAKRIFPLF